jgi:hypothetical protein
MGLLGLGRLAIGFGPVAKTRYLLGTVRLRAKFLLWHRGVLSRPDRVAKLLWLSTQAFKHPWVSDITATIRARPGHAASSPVYIDAPLVIIVWHAGAQALVMSCYFKRNHLIINQLQGVAGINIPLDLAWTTRFVAACQALARRENLKGVLLAKATTLTSYRDPDVIASGRESFDAARARVRKKMLIRYDQTAEQLGFTQDVNWWAWKNPTVQANRPP